MIKKILFAAIIVLIAISCQQSQSGNSGQQSAEVSLADDLKVKVYYFHGRMRCSNCINIQEVVKSTIADNFADNEDVGFLEVDFSDSDNAYLADKYEVAWSSVIIASDEDHINLTEEAFAMVANNTEGLKNLVLEETNRFLND
ncbi:nitrophenyl compound nitroreductase subunit ArsF family protein [Marinilabiliaceae bacterium ANBcel2]|nr:nitrophenyl compound nitroreductase subunit ArsF family protein [Marinilabiliaceae bacterium ANBcel2]